MTDQDVQQTDQEAHLSHSQVQEFLQCPYRYHLNRREKVPPDFVPSALLFGGAIHEALALYHQGRLEGKEVSVEELMAAFRERWEEHEERIEYRWGEHEAALLEMAEKMLAAYVREPRNGGQVVAIEEPFRLELSDALPPVHGRLDLVEKDSNGALILTDFKTSSGSKEPDADQLVL